MKCLQKTKIVSVLFSVALCLAFLSSVPQAGAASSDYFTTSVTTGGTYYWDLSNWSTASGGPFTSPYASCDFARFTGSGSYTVVVSNAECMAGMWQVGTGTLTITNSTNGSGSLSIASGIQGFLLSGSCVIYCPIGGTGGLEEEYEGTGQSISLSLFGSNSYSGGTLMQSSSTLVYFNNNNAFGTGANIVEFTGAGSFVPLLSTGGTTITLPNNWTNENTVSAGVNFASGVSTPVVCTGNWGLGSSQQFLIRNNGNSTAPLTLGGVISGTASGGIIFSGANASSILMTNRNTYTGETQVGSSGDSSITLEITATGSIASTTVSNFGTGSIIKLDGSNCLSTNATLDLPASPAASSINLNFTGTQSIAAIYLGGVLQPGGTYGSTTSGATYQSATFTGNGVLSTPAPPSIAQQPQSQAILAGGTWTFSVTAAGAVPLTYQWYTNSTSVSGANASSYTVSPASSNNAGTYYVIVTNSAGSVTSSVVNLIVLPTNGYNQTIVADGPMSYWLLSETNGTTAYDVIGANNGVYENVNLGQPGYSLTDPATSIGLPGSGSLPPYGSTNGYVIVSNYLPFTNYTGTGSSFTLEAWANFTNFGGAMRLFSTFRQASPNGFAFGLNSSSSLKMTQSVVQDAIVNLTNALNEGVWYLFDLANDGSYYYFYINGNLVGTVLAEKGDGVANPLQFGCNPTNYFGANENNSEQVQGYMDQVAIYSYALQASQVANHFAARYSTLAPPVVTAPIASPATNYVSLSSTLQAEAAGILLSYQWYQAPSTILTGQTNATLTFSPLALSNAGSYYVNVTNPAGSSNSPSVAITVLPIPTNASQLNLTNSLVLHLPFDSNYNDTSGLGNNGTNVGATIVPGVVGAGALSYSSTAGGPYSYVTLGAVPDLQFGTATNFSVSFWVQEPSGSTYTNLPFFTDATNSTSGSDGFAFAPYATGTSVGGGWQWLAGDGTHVATSPSQYTSFNDLNVINDGNWHNLVFVANRSANLSTYLDGVLVDQESISFIGNINNTNAVTIGQDPTGAYSVTAQAYLDDLGVWTRTLSQLEVSGIYLAGISNSVSFAPAASAIVPVNLSIVEASGQIQISWSGSGGTLQATTNATGTFTNVTGATSPYTVPTPVGKQMYYRLQY